MNRFQYENWPRSVRIRGPVERVTPREATRKPPLRRAALDAGGKDNVTVIVIGPRTVQP